MVDLKRLRELAEKSRLFGVCDKHREGDDGHGTAIVYAEQDGENYDLMTIDTAQYDAENFAMHLGAFYAAAGPKAIIELLDMLEAAQKASAWQPIETAPKDLVFKVGENCFGERILLSSGSVVFCGRWWFRSDRPTANFVNENYVAEYPTHWMPLPPAPASL